MNKIKVALSLIDLREKKFLILIFLAALFLSLLEIFSVATIIPIISSIFSNSDNGINNIKIFSLFNSLIQSFDNKNLLIISLYLFTGILVIKNLYTILFIYIKNKFLNAVKSRTSNKLLNQYLDSSYQFLRNNHSSKLIRNIEEVSSFLGYIENLIIILTETLILLTFLIFLCAINYKIVLYSFIFIIFFSFILKKFTSAKIKSIGEKRYLASRQRSRILVDIFHAYKEIKIYNKENFFINLFDSKNQEEINSELRFNILDALPKIYFEILFTLLIVFFLIFLEMQKYTPSAMTLIMATFAMSAFRFMPAANRLFRSFQILKYTYPSIKIIYDHINLNFHNNLKNEELNHKSIKFNDDIEIKNLSFKYEDSNKFILNNLNYTFKKGNLNCILGSSGSGKSTLVNIITGFFQPNSGEVTSNNFSIFSNLKLWRSNIGYISQESTILNMSIRENIALGVKKEEINEARVKEVIKLSNLDKFIKELNFGLDTICGEKGNNISGGQKQRLSIARALYFNPKILILDETTNSLDENTEKEIIQELIALKNYINIIMITHNVNINKYFDEVLRLDE